MRKSSSFQLILVISLFVYGCGGGDGGGGGSGQGKIQPGTSVAVTPQSDGIALEFNLLNGQSKLFANIKTSNLVLPENRVNAKEQYSTPHYIGRLQSYGHQDDIKMPFRSYSASCNDNGVVRMFTSQTLGDLGSTVGSIYESYYDKSTGAMKLANNESVLEFCHNSLGVNVSDDCSRVAVLCTTSFDESSNRSHEKDLFRNYHGEIFDDQKSNNSYFIDTKLDDSLASVIYNNRGDGFPALSNYVDVSDHITGLQQTFPSDGFTAESTINNLQNSNHVDYLIGTLSDSDQTNLRDDVFNFMVRYNDELWLLEWNNDQSLSEDPKAYVVNKQVGSGAGTNAVNLLNSDNDKLGKKSYAFATTTREFDFDGPGRHYSSRLTIIDRTSWEIEKMSSGDSRGWDNNCSTGHILHARAYNNQYTGAYGVICTSDSTRDYGNTLGALGTISIKKENQASKWPGYRLHHAPANSTFLSNGGGHAVVPVDDYTSLAVIVAPQLISEANLEDFVEASKAYLINEGDLDLATAQQMTDAQICSEMEAGANCFINYMEEIRYGDIRGYTPPNPLAPNLYSHELNSEQLSRVGIALVDSAGKPIDGHEIQWVASDDDCSISDPQLIDMENGRFLFGYAKFLCISDGYELWRYDNDLADHMLIPKSYYLVEVDADLNFVNGPVELSKELGWGGLDQMELLVPGKVAWRYITNPTISKYTSGQQAQWQFVVYESK